MALTRAQTAAKRSSGSTSKGTGTGEVTVKGKRATAKQRQVIDEVLTQAADDHASRRVMIATIMTITQESVAGTQNVSVSGEHLGPFHQSKSWGSEESRKDPAGATHNFLIDGPSAWKKVNGGVKSAPGNLAEGIEKVQRSGNPAGYSQWEDEATETVDQWLDSGGSSEGGTYIKQYTFTRGEKGQSRENSWDAAARLVGDVGAYRWAAGNVFYAVSGDELRAQKPSLTIRGDEGWLVKPPAWSWASGRAISEMSIIALADRWDIMPGACVTFPREFGAMAGRWMVWNVSGESLDSPVVTVVFRRPTKLRPEPASDVGQRSEGSGSDSDLKSICKQISDNRSTYLYGGGHGPPLSKLTSSSHMDCSSSCSLALYRAKMFDGNVAINSSGFASSWGKRGRGDDFTVWANSTHVWIEFEDGSRFDTSQHSGKSGPMYTTVERHDQSRFTPKHWPGN